VIIQKKKQHILKNEYMNLGKITLITPPDKLFNMNLSYLLVKPSNHIKQQFQTILSASMDDLNVFIYDTEDMDVSWLLSIAIQVDCVIVDIDNCDAITQRFVTFMLAQPNAHYITSDDITPYNLISKNRIYNLDLIVEQLKNQEDEDNDVQEE
jgi:hypothetical protein